MSYTRGGRHESKVDFMDSVVEVLAVNVGKLNLLFSWLARAVLASERARSPG